MGDNIKYSVILKNKGYLRLFLAGVISRFGDALDMIAYSYMVFELTGSAVLMASLFAVNGIPSLILNLVSGVMVSYWPKKRTVVLCDVGRGLIVMLTAFLYMNGQLHVWQLYVFTMLNSTFEAFREPASSVVMIKVVPKEDMDYAVSLDSSSRTIAELIGYSMAALLIATIGVSGTILVDGATFLVSALLISLIYLEKEVLKKEKLTLKLYFTDLKEGLSYAMTHPLVKSIVICSGGIGLFLAPFNAFQVPFVLDVMELGEFGISILSIAFMLSMIGGSLLVPILSSKVGYKNLFVTGGIVIGVGYVLLGYAPILGKIISPIFSLIIASLVMGSTLTFLTVPIRVTLMKRVDESMIPRMISLLSVFQLASVPIGGAISGVLVSVVSMTKLFVICGCAIIIIFILQSFNKNLEGLDNEVVSPMKA